MKFYSIECDRCGKAVKRKMMEAPGTDIAGFYTVRIDRYGPSPLDFCESCMTDITRKLLVPTSPLENDMEL